MTFSKKQEGSSLTYYLEGRLDTLTAPEFEKEILGALEGVTSLTVDLSGIQYISSAGLRVILAAYKQLYHKGNMKVVNANSIVKEVFEVTGMSDIIPME